MKIILAFALAGLLVTDVCAAEVKVWFSPGGGCEAEVVAEIGGAKHEVLVQAYNFTSELVGDALAAAAQRGVKVAEIQDGLAARQKGCQCDKLRAAGGAVFIDRKHAIAHNKIIIVDSKTILTGSFNFSANAEHRNAENLVRITGDAALVAAYSANWTNHLSHCEPSKNPTLMHKWKHPLN